MKWILVSVLLLLFALSTPQQPGNFRSILVDDDRPARRSIRLVSYDADFAWIAQDFGDSRDFGGNTKPGVFVHSKAHDRWLKIVQVSTQGAKFGKSPADVILQAPWNFTDLTKQETVPLPIPTGGPIHLPDKVVYDKSRAAFLMYFDTWSEEGTTMLVIQKADLIDAFMHYNK